MSSCTNIFGETFGHYCVTLQKKSLVAIMNFTRQGKYQPLNRPYSENECGSNDISLQFVGFSNVHNCD